MSTEGKVRQIRKSFKFENWWLKEEDFNIYAKNVWNSSKNKSFLNRTNHLSGQLKIWCRKKKPLQQELNSLKNKSSKSRCYRLINRTMVRNSFSYQ
jgi:hypothetical protein